MFFAGVVVFTLASAACGLAPGAGWLVAFRAVQGLGAAMLMPQTLAILTMVFPPERRGAAFGVWGAVAGVATIAGPTLGGLLVTTFDWRYIFFINIPVGAVVLILTIVLVPDLRTGQRHSFDLVGVLLASGALLAICFGLVEGQRTTGARSSRSSPSRWSSPSGSSCSPCSYGSRPGKQGGEPLVPFSLFRDRNYSLMNFVAATISIGILGIYLPFVIYLQSVLGFSALKAGLTLAPASVIAMFIAPVAGRLSDRIGGKYILITGLICFSVGMGWLALIAQPASAWYDFFAPQLVGGHRHGLHVRADDHGGHAQHQPADGRGRVGHVQHDPPGGQRDRHRRRGRTAAEPAPGRADQPGPAAHGRAARGDQGSSRQRVPGRGQERPGGRFRAEADRPGRSDLHATASSTPCGRPCSRRSGSC